MWWQLGRSRALLDGVGLVRNGHDVDLHSAGAEPGTGLGVWCEAGCFQGSGQLGCGVEQLGVKREVAVGGAVDAGALDLAGVGVDGLRADQDERLTL